MIIIAQAQLTASIFKWATGWISDDLLSGIADSFYSSKNINIRDNAKWISLNNALVKDTGTVITEKINAIFKTTTGKIMAFGNSWGIYRKDTTTWVKITTDSPATTIYDACEFNGYIYRATATYLHRLLVTNLSDNITATDVINRQALTSAVYHPIKVSMWDMYVGHGGLVGKVNISNVWEALLVMDSWGVVKTIDDLGWSIRVTTYPSTGNSNLYLWNWIAAEPDQTIPLNGYDIRQSIIFNWYNYLVTNRGLGILDGYKIYPVKKTPVFNNNINSVMVYNEKLYVWGTGWVYVYGTQDIKYPEVLNMAFSTSNGVATDIIWAIYSTWDDLYVSWSNVGGTTFGIDKLSTTVFYTTWELVTRGYYNSSLSEIKETVKAIIGYSTLITGQEVSVAYSVDWWSYTTITTITSATVLADLFTEDLAINSGDFQYIQFKISLVWPWTSTPSFYTLDLVFNGNIKR